MEKQGTTLDSTRLSLDVANLPLTPFGMAHRGSGRKKHPVGSPNRNKLSLKTVRSPAKDKAENKPQTDNRKTNRQVSLLKSFNTLPHTGQTQTHHFQEISTNLATVYESEDTEEGECFAASERPRIPEVIPKFSANSVIIQEQNTDDADGYNRKRESIFTDIDDGSFVEFYYGKENNPPVQIIKEQRITIPQLYYTCDSNNETHFSTSTKAKGAVVGFRKFIEKMKYDNTIHEIVVESPDGRLNHIFPPRRNFPTDETIITGSLDVLRSTKKTNPKQNAALNSTMIRSSLNHQNYPDICLPDISTLTLQIDTNSGKSSPNTSPFAARNCHTTVVLESPDHDQSSGVNPRLGNEALQCEDEVVLPSNIRSDSSCHSNINAIPCAVYVERDRLVKDRIGKEIFYNPCEQNSLISEDVSVVNSLPNERPCDQFNVIPDGTKSRNNPHSYISHGNVDNKRTCKTQNYLHMKDNASSERRVFRYSPQKLTSPHPDLNSPEVARWILTSPFKEGSKGSSFLLRRDTFEGSETPSCPRVRNGGNSADKFVPQSSPMMDEIPRFSCAKEQVPFQNPENTPGRPDQVSGRLSRNVVGSVSSDRYFSPSTGNGGNSVSNWIMTSPFEDGSYGSSFLLQDVPSDISQTVSQHKPTQVPDSDGTCEKSHYLRVQERIKTCNRSLLSSFQSHNDGGNKHSSDCENSDDGMRSKSKNLVTQNIVISESDDSFGSKQGLESLLKNVNTRKRINKSYISQSTELFSEDSESLHLKLSGAFTRSLKTSEKSLYTVGKDAVSPKHTNPVVPVHKGSTSPEHKDPVVLVHKGTVSSPKHKDPVGPVHKDTVASPKHKDPVVPVHKGTTSPKHKDPVVPVHKGTVSSPKHKVLVTPKLKDAPSPDAASSSSCTGSSSEASDSESFIKPNIASCNRVRRISESDEDETSYVLLPDITESGEDRKQSRGTKESFLKGQQEFNKKSLNNNNGRPKRTTKKLIEYITSDEDSSSESSFILSGTKVCKNQVTQGNEETQTSNMGKKMSDCAYSPSNSSESEDESSFEDYLRSVKKKIHEEKVAKTEPLLKTGLSMESFINDDESGDDVSFYLPPLSERLKPKMRPSHNLDGRCVGSVSSDLEARIMGRQSKKNISKENGNKPKFSKSPISTLETPTVKEPGVNMNSWRTSVVLNISSDSDSDLDSDVFPEKEKVKNIDCPQSFVTPGSKAPPKVKARTEIRQKQVEKKLECSGTPTLTFLASLSSTIHTIRCHPDALLFVKNFKKKREELCQKLYSYYNEHVFSNKLPSVMSIKWNARLTKTAGYCYYQIDRTKPNGRGARIELSSKVIDVPERLRDTLIHEMCHAAAWIISGYKDGHGPLWKSWAAKARSVFPELPAITTCHSYEINCKYTYRCTKCSYSIGRHSKSLDTERKVCGLCFGKFELIINSKGRGSKSSNSGTPSYGSQTPRTPGAFALFVKENYNSVKKSRQNLKHVDVMKILSADFAKLKTGSN